jgi:hypothetical protein
MKKLFLILFLNYAVVLSFNSSEIQIESDEKMNHSPRYIFKMNRDKLFEILRQQQQQREPLFRMNQSSVLTEIINANSSTTTYLINPKKQNSSNHNLDFRKNMNSLIKNYLHAHFIKIFDNKTLTLKATTTKTTTTTTSATLPLVNIEEISNENEITSSSNIKHHRPFLPTLSTYGHSLDHNYFFYFTSLIVLLTILSIVLFIITIISCIINCKQRQRLASFNDNEFFTYYNKHMPVIASISSLSLKNDNTNNHHIEISNNQGFFCSNKSHLTKTWETQHSQQQLITKSILTDDKLRQQHLNFLQGQDSYHNLDLTIKNNNQKGQEKGEEEEIEIHQKMATVSPRPINFQQSKPIFYSSSIYDNNRSSDNLDLFTDVNNERAILADDINKNIDNNNQQINNLISNISYASELEEPVNLLKAIKRYESQGLPPIINSDNSINDKQNNIDTLKKSNSNLFDSDRFYKVIREQIMLPSIKSKYEIDNEIHQINEIVATGLNLNLDSTKSQNETTITTSNYQDEYDLTTNNFNEGFTQTPIDNNSKKNNNKINKNFIEINDNNNNVNDYTFIEESVIGIDYHNKSDVLY